MSDSPRELTTHSERIKKTWADAINIRLGSAAWDGNRTETDLIYEERPELLSPTSGVRKIKLKPAAILERIKVNREQGAER